MPYDDTIDDIMDTSNDTDRLISDNAKDSSRGPSLIEYPDHEILREHTCEQGICDKRQKCVQMLSKYNSRTSSLSSNRSDTSVRGKDRFQSNRFMLLLITMQLSMFIVSY